MTLAYIDMTNINVMVYVSMINDHNNKLINIELHICSNDDSDDPTHDIDAPSPIK